MVAGSPYLRTSYAEELSLFYTSFRRFWLASGICGAAVLPIVLSDYSINLLILVGIAIIAALGLNVVTGYAGQISLGHAGFLGAGAYVAGAMSYHLEGLWDNFWLVALASLLIGGILGLLVGLPALRLRGLYLALSTLSFHFIILHVLSRYQEYLRSLGTGIDILLPSPDIGFITLRSYEEWYYFILTCSIVAIAFVKNLERTRTGRAWIAIRDNEVAAEVIGVDVARYKLLAFMINSSMAAISGCLYAYYIRVVNVENFTIALSIQYLAIIIIGGMGSVLGSILGATFVVLLPYAIDFFFDSVAVPSRFAIFQDASTLGVFAIMMLFFLLMEPLGLAGIWSRIRAFFELWPFKVRPLEGQQR